MKRLSFYLNSDLKSRDELGYLTNLHNDDIMLNTEIDLYFLFPLVDHHSKIPSYFTTRHETHGNDTARTGPSVHPTWPYETTGFPITRILVTYMSLRYLSYSLLSAETSHFSCSTILSVTMSLNAAGAISEHTVPSEKASGITRDESINREGGVVETATVDADNEQGVLSDERDIATHVISVDDNASLNPWTLRAFFIGLGLSTFGGVLGELL